MWVKQIDYDNKSAIMINLDYFLYLYIKNQH